MTFKKFVGMPAFLLLTGCISPALAPRGLPPTQLVYPAQTAAQESVRQQLVDPESARFGRMAAFQRDKDSIVVCGSVNAKNGFGGYSGSAPFAVILMKAKRPDGVMLYLNAGIKVAVRDADDEQIFYAMFPVCQGPV